MQHNQHKRLARKILPRFEPTWTGQAVDPTGTLLAPVATTPDANAQPTTSSQQPLLPTTSLAALPTSLPALETTSVQVQPTTSSAQSSSTLAAVVTESTTSSVLSSSTIESTTTSTTPLATSTAPASSSATPVQTTAAPATTPRAAATTAASSAPSVIRSSSMYTNSRGDVVQTIVVVQAPAPTPSETEAPKSTGNAGTIVGAVAGGFVGLICLIAFVSWVVRKHNKRKGENHDDFDRQSYLRNSMMIPDEPGSDHPARGTQAALALARSNTHLGPRPPTMIERKNTYYSHGQPSPSFAPGQFASFEPGQIVSAPGTAAEPAYPSPVAFAGYTPPDQYHQSELVRHPSGAQLLNRAPTNGGMYDNASYAPSPVSYGPESYGMHSPDSYGHDGYTYPMNPGVVDHRGMVQSVTPFQAEQYAEITRQLEGTGYGHDSFHPISPGPGPASPVGQAVSGSNLGSPTKGSPLDEKPTQNPFDESVQRIDSTPPALPPIESLSRTGTPIDPNPQHAHWSYDGKTQNEGNRLSVAGMPMPEPPTPPPMAAIREDHPVQAPVSAPAPAPTAAPNAAAQPAKRPVSVFDVDDAYGGM